MSLEEDAHDLGNGQLEIILVVVLLLDDFQVILIELFIFVLRLSLILGELIVLLDPRVGVVVKIDENLGQSDHAVLREDTLADLVDDLLGCLDLADEGVSLGLLVDGLPERVQEDSAHVLQVKDGAACSLYALDKSREGSSY